MINTLESRRKIRVYCVRLAPVGDRAPGGVKVGGEVGDTGSARQESVLC